MASTTNKTYSIAVHRVDLGSTRLMTIRNSTLEEVHSVLESICHPEGGRRKYGLDPDPARHGNTEWNEVWLESWDQWINLDNGGWVLEGGLINLADGEVDYTFRVERDDYPQS